MRKIIVCTLITMALTMGTNPSFGHGGGLDSDGGHNCRVGSCAGTYHCHQAWGPACGGGPAANLPRKSITPKCIVESASSLSVNNIAMVQIKLKSKGFNPGTIDGSYGDGSKKALNNYEKKNKLTTSTGSRINSETLEHLGVNC